jgi:hypothetical protein
MLIDNFGIISQLSRMVKTKQPIQDKIKPKYGKE